jgi:hypothetical protein
MKKTLPGCASDLGIGNKLDILDKVYGFFFFFFFCERAGNMEIFVCLRGLDFVLCAHEIYLNLCNIKK